MVIPTHVRMAVRRIGAEGAVNLRQRRTWFDETGSTQQAATGETPNPGTAPAQSGTEAKFTQADVDRIIGERVKRAEEGGLKKLLGDLGVDSAEALTNLVKERKQREEAEKSEAQRAQDKIAAAEKKAQEAESRLAQIEVKRQEEGRDNAIKSALSEAHTKKASSVLVLMKDSHPDLVTAALKDGAVNSDAVKKLVDEAKKLHPEMFTGSGPGSPSNGGGQVPEPNKAAKEEARVRQKTRLKRSF